MEWGGQPNPLPKMQVGNIKYLEDYEETETPVLLIGVWNAANSLENSLAMASDRPWTSPYQAPPF